VISPAFCNVLATIVTVEGLARASWAANSCVSVNCFAEPQPFERVSEPNPIAARQTKRSPQVTSTPEPPAPQLLCPICDRPLVYRHTET
jgi:hypothetical protein